VQIQHTRRNVVEGNALVLQIQEEGLVEVKWAFNLQESQLLAPAAAHEAQVMSQAEQLADDVLGHHPLLH